MIAVCIATYNQESFIAQAVESALMQVCDQPIRIYIGDDASTDGTQAVCERYAAQDKRIVYVRREKNMGLVDNTIDLYRRIIADGCSYIAMLDGDDYWIAPHKLQMQVDYMRAYPEYGFVHTAAYDDVDGERINADHPDKPVGDIRECYNRQGASHTNCTVLFRTQLLQEEELNDLQKQHFLVLDYPLYGIFSQRTYFGYIHTYTAAWRRHSSVSHARSLHASMRYLYHYARAWRWLDKKYPKHFHFRWDKAILWFLWQNFYFLFAQFKKKL